MNTDNSSGKFPEEGDLKVRQFFAWYPIIAGWKMRWLCMVRVEYIYVFDDGTYAQGWVPNRFLELEHEPANERSTS